MRTRESHTLHESTVNALRGRKNGLTLRTLAVSLSYPESYAATLSDVLRAKPGTLTLAAENDLRQRLGLPAIGLREVPACPSCGQVHVAGDCHGRPVAAVVVLSMGERVTQRRPAHVPDRIADYPVAQLRAALLRRYTYRGGI